MIITSVVHKEKNDRTTKNFQETGILTTYSLIRKCSTSCKNNNSNMLLTYYITLICCLVSLLPQPCLATSSVQMTTYPKLPSPLPPPYECSSKDIRNNCTELEILQDCTVITGTLDIVLLPVVNSSCNFNQYQFKNLKEITGFLIFNDVRNLTNITDMFPNLTVIRGQQVFLNYAFAVSAMNALERLEFRSLIAIQRGHIFVEANPKLCNTEGIYWDRLTLKPGENHIFLADKAQCPVESKCNGCLTDYCWSDQVCQKFESDSVLSLTQDIKDCDEECLGGCYNHTAQGCVVCKTWTDHGTCVNECPRDKYACKQYLRCYTRDECVQQKKLFVYKKTCIDSCPGGFKINHATGECDSCGGINTCLKTCNPPKFGDPIIINHLMNVELLRGCQILNSSVLITIHNRIDEQELMENLQDVREIMGHLKVNRSPHLTSLNFFKNLETIHGKPMENNQYSLIIYNNKNLKELWKVKTGFKLKNGGMYIFENNKLCNHHIQDFQNNVQHDKSKDSLQKSDQEVLCAPAKLNLYLEVLSHRSIKLSWPKKQTSTEVEIIYRPVNEHEQLSEESEIDTEVCKRINWRRELKFPHEFVENITHYSYVVNNLKSHTKYAALVKIFGSKDTNHEARSEIKYITTEIDVPLPPIILLKAITYNSLTVELQYENREDKWVDFYILEVYDIPDDKNMLDKRDYCDDDTLLLLDYAFEDYEHCCSRREEEQEDRLFLKQLRNEFSCSLDQPEYCEKNHQENNLINHRKTFYTKRLEHSEHNHTIRNLERFHMYAIQVHACNHAGCGSYNVTTTRTNYSIAADGIDDLSACKMANNNEYRVYFSEPKLPNGYITSYDVHFRYFRDPGEVKRPNHIDCLTRLEHEQNHFVYRGNWNETFNQAAVRVFSLGHSTMTDWITITTCPSTKLAGRSSSHGWNIFFIFFLIGAAGTLLWVCYKRKYWRKIPELRRFLPLHMGWRYLRPETETAEDRQILVDGFEAVRFHNSQEDDMKYLVH